MKPERMLGDHGRRPFANLRLSLSLGTLGLVLFACGGTSDLSLNEGSGMGASSTASGGTDSRPPETPEGETGGASTGGSTGGRATAGGSSAGGSSAGGSSTGGMLNGGAGGLGGGSGGMTEEPSLCAEDEYVDGNECVTCPINSTNPAGDDPTGEDTSCEALNCEELIDLVPVMSSASDDVGSVTDSGNFAGAGWQVFNGESAGWLSELWESPAWLAYEFKNGPETVERYSIKYTNGALTTRAPRDWTFEAWDGDAWIELDVQSEQTDWISGEVRIFTVAEPAPYSSYRLQVTKDNDTRSDIVTVSIGEMELLASPCVCDPTPTSQVPTMSDADHEVGTVTSSGHYSSGDAWKAFNGESAGWLSELWESPAWLAYEFKEGTRHLTQYAITFTNGALTTRAPRNFSLQGFDGDSWVTLDTQTNQTDWISGETRTYDITSPGDFAQYRVHFTHDNDSRSDIVTVSLGKLDLIGHTCGG